MVTLIGYGKKLAIDRLHCAAVICLFCKIHIWFNKTSAVNGAVQGLYLWE